ncbi:hypothetical protein ABZ479_23120 [Streptomyces sp. NPDC005722]
MSSGPAFRLARAAVFAAVCVTVTGLGHALMSRAVPGWAVGYAFAATTAGAWWLAGRRERGALTVTGATVGAQFALHAWFGLAQAFAAAPADAGPAYRHTAAAMGAMPMSASPAGGWTTGMAAAHALAAALCGLWLWRGEAAVFRAGRALAAVLLAPLRRAVRTVLAHDHAAPARPAASPRPARPPRRTPLRHTVARRGPPKPAISC